MWLLEGTNRPDRGEWTVVDTFVDPWDIQDAMRTARFLWFRINAVPMGRVRFEHARNEQSNGTA
jgi:hypothetical protein